eukprot:1159756-Pelagomonas_calceolata.AAC.10
MNQGAKGTSKSQQTRSILFLGKDSLSIGVSQGKHLCSNSGLDMGLLKKERLLLDGKHLGYSSPFVNISAKPNEAGISQALGNKYMASHG